MQYPQDGGVSAIRFHLCEPEHPLVRVATAALTVAHHDAGYLICQCGVPDWWRLYSDAGRAVLSCGCNGSSLPLYIGPPPGEALPDHVVTCAQHPDTFAAAAIAIGYAGSVPALGTLDAERAQEIVVALACRHDPPDTGTPDFARRAVTHVAGLTHAFVGWALRLPAPFPIAGHETWLSTIHYLKRD